LKNVKTTLLGERLKALRGEKTLYEVNEESGINRGTLQRYENGTQIPGDEALEKLAKFYGVDLVELKKLWVVDLFPPGSLGRKALQLWLAEGGLK